MIECDYCAARFEVLFEDEGWEIVNCPCCGSQLNTELDFEDD